MQNEEIEAMKNMRTVGDLQVSVSLLIKPRCDGANPQGLNSQGCAHEYAWTN